MKQTESVLKSMQVDRRDPKNFIKFNLLQRFQDNFEDKKGEFARLRDAIEFQRKKQALFKETLETKEHTIGNGLKQEDEESIKRLKDENDLRINIQMTGDILDSAEHLEFSLNYQKSRLQGISKKVKTITSKNPDEWTCSSHFIFEGNQTVSLESEWS